MFTVGNLVDTGATQNMVNMDFLPTRIEKVYGEDEIVTFLYCKLQSNICLFVE